MYHEGGYDLPKTTIPTNGLVAWYPFSGNAIDSSGNGNNGTVNGATLTTDRFGKANSYSFNGASSKIDAMIINPVNTKSISGLSLSGWSYLNSLNNQPNTILSLWDAVIDTSYGIVLDYTTNKFVGMNGLSGAGALLNISSQNTTKVKQWYHIALSCDYSTNTAKLFINGILQSVATVNLFRPTLKNIRIGYWTNNYWIQNGNIDDIRIYNRGLDSTEIQALYHEGGYNGTLPLTITNISAINNGDKVAINWATANELNTNLFAVQHSADGINFTTINTVKAKGNGGYSFLDNNPINGTNYYRLKCVDKDGSISYSKIVSVQFSIINSQLSIFPNPTKDKTTISFGKLIDKATIAVYDITGKAIFTQQINNSTNTYQLNTQKLTKGIYIVKVKTGAGSANGKLVIEK